MADSVRVAQGLVDMPPNKLTTTEFKDFVVSTATGSPGVSQTVIEGEELQQRGYGGLWNVGKCAENAALFGGFEPRGHWQGCGVGREKYHF